MMKIGYLRASLLAALVALISGCGGSSGGVHAIAPGTPDQLVGVAPANGEYTLYRAVNYAEGYDSHVEPVWSVQVQQGQKMGFRWAGDGLHTDGHGAFHLIAFAGGEARDLGPFKVRDMSYAWAGTSGDVSGYFGGRSTTANVGNMLMIR